MRIQYYTDESFPNPNANCVQMVQNMAALQRAGAQVRMICPVTPRAWAAGPASAARAFRQALEAYYHVACDFEICVLPTRAFEWRPSIKTAHGGLATAVALASPAEVLYTRNLPPVPAALAARRLVLFETYRPLPRQFPWSAGFFRKLGSHRFFAGVVTHSNVARDAFVEAGLPPDRVQTVYNGFDQDLFTEQRSTAEARAALGLPDRPTLAYTGRIDSVKGLDLLMDAAAATPQWQWVLAGATDTEGARPHVARAATLPNVTLLGYLTGPSLSLVMQAADVLFVPPSVEPLARHGTTVLPMKIFPYLAARRAIVAGRVPDAMEILEHDRNAWLVEPDNLDRLLQALARVMADAPLRARLAAGANQTAQDLTWDGRAGRLLSFLDRRLRASRGA